MTQNYNLPFSNVYKDPRKGLEVFSSSEADSTSQMIVPIFSVDSVKFSVPEGKQGCTPTDLCRFVNTFSLEVVNFGKLELW